MSTPDDKNKNKKRHGSGRPAKPAPSKDIQEEQYWGQGRQQKEREDRQPPE